MKILDVSNITTTAQLPIKKGTLQFLQDAYKESISNLIKGLIGSSYSTSIYYILYGCENSGVGSNYIISNGAIFYNGEIYEVDGTTFTTGGGQSPVMNIVTTQYTVNADPVTFTNAVQYNVHDIRKIVISAGTASGNVYGVNSLSVFVNFANSTPNIIEQGNFANLQTKVINIGTWDMSSSLNLQVNHGIADFKKIRSVNVLIVDDSESVILPINALYYNSGVTEGAGNYSIWSTYIEIIWFLGGYFDNTNYHGTTVNRGTITITYEA